MAILTGPMTVRRFRVVGEVPEGFRDVFRKRLQEHAFADPPQGIGKEEVEGWVQVHNLLDTDFTDFNRWLYNQYVVIGLRVDKKALPAKLFRATLEKRAEAWCQERGVERCPGSVRNELKEALETEWLKKALPRVAVTECCWNIGEGWLVLHALSDSVADRFRKRFLRTFGLRAVPWSPLDWSDNQKQVETLMAAVPTPMVQEA